MLKYLKIQRMGKNENTANPQGGKARKEKVITGTRLDDLRYFENSLTRQMYRATSRLEFSLRPTGWAYGPET